MYDIIELNAKKVPELKEIAKKLGVSRAEKLKKQDLVYSILDEQALKPTATKKAPAKAKKDGDANKRTRNTRTKKSESDAKDELRAKKSEDSPNAADEKKERKPGDAIRERRARRKATEESTENSKPEDAKEASKDDKGNERRNDRDNDRRNNNNNNDRNNNHNRDHVEGIIH